MKILLFICAIPCPCQHKFLLLLCSLFFCSYFDDSRITYVKDAQNFVIESENILDFPNVYLIEMRQVYNNWLKGYLFFQNISRRNMNFKKFMT